VEVVEEAEALLAAQLVLVEVVVEMDSLFLGQ